MADNSSDNKTEKATQKKKRDARKKGQIPRSREVVNFSVLLISSIYLFVVGKKLYTAYAKILASGFTITRNQLNTHHFILHKAAHLILKSFLLFTPFPVLTILAIYIGNILLGGQTFTLEKIKPKLSNVNPMEGLKKLFSTKGAVDLLQSIIKCLLVGITAYSILKTIHPKLLKLSLMPVEAAMHYFGNTYFFSFLILTFSLILILFIDVPYQLYQYHHKLKMSKQELKDEFKQTEGNPQIKGRIKRLQRQAAKRRRMLKQLPETDILITNPTHIAVALKYDEENMDAPVILAMGADLMAMHIRRVASELNIPVLQIPLLARALYYNGEIGEEIPEMLFHAVAQVVSYIYRLDNPLNFHLDRYWIEQLPIPEACFTDEKAHDQKK